MTSSIAETNANRLKGRFQLLVPLAALAGVLVATGYMRLTLGAYRPLWLDEAQTGMLIIQPTLADFVRQCTYDINGPLYYVLARIWAQFNGVSDHALRVLPTVLSFLAPLVALLPRKLIDRPTRFTWCALLACWIPGIIFAQEARWYTLALALGVANTVAFIALLRNPTREAVWGWTTISSLMVLAHYYGVFLLAFQGPAFLLIHRRRAIAAWPAALAFIPAIAAIAVHASRLVSFVTPATTWIPLEKPIDLFWNAGFILGNAYLVFILGFWFAMASVVRLRSGALRDIVTLDLDDGVWIALACAAMPVCLVVGLGFLKPVFVSRYLIVFVPALLLGLAKFANRFERSSKVSAAMLVGFVFAFVIAWARWLQPDRDIHDYNFETASNALIATKPNRLVFLWDNPLKPEPALLSGLGGFFFARAGLKIPIDPVILPVGADPNRVLLARASSPGSAILWISDRRVRGTASVRFPPAIDRIDPTWTCRNFGNWQYRIMACSRDPGWRIRFPPLAARAGRTPA
jgi:hypothetical protein